MVNYCKKHDYWENEINKRTEIKVKHIPTKEELKIKRLENQRLKLILYEKKLIRYNKLYSNKIKRIKRSIIMLERPKKDLIND